MLRRALVGLLLGLVVLLAGVLPVAGATLSGDPPNSLNGLEATYNVTAAIKWKKKRLNVTSTAIVTNNSDAAVEALTFNLAPAKTGGAILGDVTVDGTLATATINDQNVVVTLPVPLEPTEAGDETRIAGGNRRCCHSGRV